VCCSYETCLKHRYAVAATDGALRDAAQADAFDACLRERDAIERTLPPADVERVMARVDQLARAGLGKE
jgi:hypothetical protein